MARKIPARPIFRRLFFAPTQKKAAEEYKVITDAKIFAQKQFAGKKQWLKVITIEPLRLLYQILFMAAG